ncbi:hypothetical protein [Streptomyces sp. JJ38]|uniref:hypothetical protein n=1 Tax=Streptomyces sp. JJ38 TaxID=2738128 RepID=UPI001C55D15F|nr:hypothetical protein [Streptomyces sp. JJ38]MBW1597748.1 hypothetical protein [Streptomyces sp. JJ38]
MDAQIVELARAAGTAVVGALATEAWQSARDGLMGLWQRVHPERAEGVGAELAASRDELLAAREAGDELAEEELRTEWQARVRRLLVERPELADELRVLLDELRPAQPEQAGTTVTLNATASGRARVYQAGRDQRVGEG